MGATNRPSGRPSWIGINPCNRSTGWFVPGTPTSRPASPIAASDATSTASGGSGRAPGNALASSRRCPREKCSPWSETPPWRSAGAGKGTRTRPAHWPSNNFRDFSSPPGESGGGVFGDLGGGEVNKGGEIDFGERLIGGGFTVHNPNAVSSCSCGSSFDTGGDAGTAHGCSH